MRRIAVLLSIAGIFALPCGCGPSMKSIIEARIPELKKLELGAYDLGEFKNGQMTPYRILPVMKGERRNITFRTEPENRHFSIVLDDGRVFRFDDDKDLAELSMTRLESQSFYLEFRQDMRMIVVISPQPAQLGARE